MAWRARWPHPSHVPEDRLFWMRVSLLSLLALVIRLAHVYLVDQAVGSAQIHDAAYYHDVALVMRGRLSAPELWGSVAFANLGYPHFLSWIYAVVAAPGAVLILQSVFGATTAMLTGVLARDVFRSRRVGLWATGLSAIYVPSVFYDGLLLIPSLSALATVTLAWSLNRAIDRRSLPWAVVAGLSMTVATLLRSSQFLLLPAAFLAVYRIAARNQGARDHGARKHSRPLFLCLALLVGSAVGLAPIGIDQRIEAGRWIPLTSNGGVNFWIGNHRGASGTYADAPFIAPSRGGDFRHTIIAEREGFLAESRRRSSRPDLSLADSDAFWWREAWREIVAAPSRWAHLMTRKLLCFANDYEARTNASLDLMQEISPLLGLNPVRFGAVEVLAALGVVQLRPRHRRARWMLGILVLVAAVTCLGFFVSGEYRHPAAPALIALAAFGLERVTRKLGQVRRGQATLRRLVPAPLPMLIVVVVAAFAFAPTERLGPARDRKAYAESLAMPNSDGTPPTLERYTLARALLARHGEDLEDRVLSQEALLLVESNQAIQFRDRQAAERLMRTVEALWRLDLQPSATLDASAISRIRGNSVRRIAQLCRQPFVKQWPEIERRLSLLGGHSWDEVRLLMSRKQTAQAQAFVEHALAVAPQSIALLAYRSQLESLRAAETIERLKHLVRTEGYDEALLYTLGDLMLRYDSTESLVEFFSTELTRDEKPQTSHYFIAMGYQERGDHAAAIAEFRLALEIDPAHESSQRQWGLTLERQGELTPALEHLIEATRIHPEYREALLDVARLLGRLGREREAEAWRERARTAVTDTPRRFLYWATYLHDHGRDSAALLEIERALEANPRDPQAISLREAIRTRQAVTRVATSRRPIPGGSPIGETVTANHYSP